MHRLKRVVPASRVSVMQHGVRRHSHELGEFLMMTSGDDLGPDVHDFDEHHKIIQLVNDDRSASELLNVFIVRQCSDHRKVGHRIANITFVSGALEATILGFDARGLHQLATAMSDYASKFLKDE